MNSKKLSVTFKNNENMISKYSLIEINSKYFLMYLDFSQLYSQFNNVVILDDNEYKIIMIILLVSKSNKLS